LRAVCKTNRNSCKSSYRNLTRTVISEQKDIARPHVEKQIEAHNQELNFFGLLVSCAAESTGGKFKKVNNYNKGGKVVPKLKQSPDEHKNLMFQAYLSKNMTLYGVDIKRLSLKLQLSERTLRNKIKRPETFTVCEIRKAFAVLKFSDVEKAEIM